MTANPIPGPAETLALIRELRDAARAALEGEARLAQELQRRTADIAREAAQADQHEAAALAARLAAEEASLRARRDRLAAWHARRQTRLAAARAAGRRAAVAAAEAEEGRRKFALQKATVEAGQRRAAALAEAAARLKEFQARLKDLQARLEAAAQDAHRTFGGFDAWRRLLARPDEQWPRAHLEADEETLLQRVERFLGEADGQLAVVRRAALPRLFRAVPASVWVVLGLLAAGAVAVLPRFDVTAVPVIPGTAAALSVALLAGLLHFVARRRHEDAAERVARCLAQARQLHVAAGVRGEAAHAAEEGRIEQEYTAASERLAAEWEVAVAETAAAAEARPRAVDERAARLAARQEAALRRRETALEAALAEVAARLQSGLEQARHDRAAAAGIRLAAAREEHGRALAALADEGRARLDAARAAALAAVAAADAAAPAWDAPAWADWQPPVCFLNAARLGALHLDLPALAGGAPADLRLVPALDGLPALPLCLTPPAAGSVLFETGAQGGGEAVAAMNNLVFRVLTTTPPGKVRLTLLDAAGLGENFAALMHLADYEGGPVDGRIWTQPGQFEARLGELGEHVEKVIQMYLRNDFPTLAEYNAAAGAVAEKLHVLVIAGFPAGFTDVALRRLLNLVASGARCGVQTFIQWDRRQPPPFGLVADDLRRHALVLAHGGHGFELAGAPAEELPGVTLRLEAPPPAALATELLHRIGRAGSRAGRVEVPFAQVAPAPGAEWTETTADEVRVPVGRTGATKLQQFALGRGTRQHALVAGKTGSGKSTLFHVLVTGLALRCSPDEVEFYLIDFKKGVEFRAYAARRLPHARVVAVESDRQFGLSVLERLDEELRRRGELFRQAGVQDLPGWRAASAGAPLPRTLLVIDEFQEFFTEEDRIAQQAAVLLDRLVRQGRAFGLHVVLGSQTLGGAYSLARATLGQMVVRVALQCNEADAGLIFDENNLAPRLLSRPGEGIYNDAAGAAEGNSPFQVVWLAEDERDRRLADLRARADERGFVALTPVVFEGNAPADVRDNAPLSALLAAPAAASAAAPRLWLGAPNSIKGPTETAFPAQGGAHLLLVGQRDDAVLAIFTVALVALAAQFPPGGVRFVVLDPTAPGTAARAGLDRAVAAVPAPVTRAGPPALAATLGELAAEVRARAEGAAAPDPTRVFVLLPALPLFRKLRQDDDFSFGAGADEGPNPAALLMELLREGPAQGLHVLAACDTWGNVNRFLGRKGLAEFAARVLFQMSATDSAALADVPDANQLGLHRALFFHEREGTLETFRPYGRPDDAWLAAARRALAR
jgi:hypothetical protein